MYYYVVNTIGLLLGRRDELTPPRRMWKLVGRSDFSDFKQAGEEFLRYFIEFGRLKPNESVLDVGCGIGRMAVPLTKYLDKKGSYEGFDIAAEGINWSKKMITPKFPNFHFQLANIYNGKYNPKGKYKASEFKFPYENESFDFVFLTSVFTHMLPQDIENYFSEIARVLKRDGRCLITFFILNSESLKLIDAKLSFLDFQYRFGEYCIVDEGESESAVAYDERLVRVFYEKFGFEIVEPIRYGSWCGRKNFTSFQDIVIAAKK